MIEEMDQLPPEILSAAYEQAGEWLSTSQSQDIKLRVERAGKKLALQGIQKVRARLRFFSIGSITYRKKY